MFSENEKQILDEIYKRNPYPTNEEIKRMYFIVIFLKISYYDVKERQE